MRNHLHSLPPNLASLLLERFHQHLPLKRNECLTEIEGEIKRGPRRGDKLNEAVRQRRVAFLEAQVVNICMAVALGVV